MQGRVAVITGATGGLGATVFESFLAAGTKVAVTYTNEEKLEAITSKFDPEKGEWLAVKTNVLEESSVKSLVAAVMARYGRLDFLVNLVGGFLGGVSIADTTAEQWDHMFDLNLRSTFFCCKHVFPIMQKQNFGRIITIGSKGGLQGMAGMAAYAASKAGLINLTQSLAAEGRGYNIHANVVIPSIIDTPANRKAMPDASYHDWVTPRSLARVILFLCSEDANDINGAALPVFGNA